MVMRREISDEAWSVLAPFFPTWKGVGRPILDMRQVVEAIAWRFRTGSPWRDVPERFGNWNSIYGYFSDWCKDGTWARVLAEVQGSAQRAHELDWTVSIDSSIARVHQHGATLARGSSREAEDITGGMVELQESAGRAGRRRAGRSRDRPFSRGFDLQGPPRDRRQRQAIGAGVDQRPRPGRDTVADRAGHHPGARWRSRQAARASGPGAGR